MRLNFSKNKELTLNEAVQHFEDIAAAGEGGCFEKFPDFLQWVAGAVPEFISDETSVKKNIRQLAEEYFFHLMLGRHQELRWIFGNIAIFDPDSCVVGDCRLTALLGRGSSGCVFACADGRCVKIVPAAGKADLRHEYEIMNMLRHPGIVECHSFREDGRCAAMVMEKVVPEICDEKCEYLRALAWCHKQGVLHGDLRLKNLGVSRDGRGKLLDFGKAVFYTDPQMIQREKKMLELLLSSPSV